MDRLYVTTWSVSHDGSGVSTGSAGTTTWSGSIALQAQQLYAVEMDYFQAQGGAVAQLSWTSPSTAPSIIPQTQLYPITTLPPVCSS